MLKYISSKLEDPERPFLGPNVRALKFWGLILPKNSLKKYFYILMHISVTIFTATEYIDIWFVKSDINLLLNNIKITMLATVSVCKVSTFLYWQKNWLNIIEYVTKTDLEQRTTMDEINKMKIKNFTRYCRKITYSYWSLMYTTVIIVMGTPVFKYILSPSYRENVRNKEDVYLQVVSSWVPFDKNTMLGYLTASVLQSYAAIYGGGWITSFDTNAMVTMVFFQGELELLRRDCSKIFGTTKLPVSDELAKKRLKDCHRRHVLLVHHARVFNNCLSPIMLLYMLVCSIMLCVTAFQITTETSIMQRLLTTEYLVFGVAQLFIYCWHGNDVLFAVGPRSNAPWSASLKYGPYESKWFSMSTSLQKDLYMLMAQFQKTVKFTAGPFSDLTVATFLNILKGAYSYYTLLSQSQM